MMRKVTGLNYYYKLDCMIKECIEKAALNPFEQFIFIVEDKKMVEKRFFLYTLTFNSNKHSTLLCIETAKSSGGANLNNCISKFTLNHLS